MEEFRLQKRAEELRQEATAESAGKAPQTSKRLTYRELRENIYPDAEYLVDRLIPAECTTAVSGAPASNKTWLLMDLAIRVALGEAWLDRFVCKQTGVMLVDEENGERLLQSRIKKLSDQIELPIYFQSLAGFKLTKESVEELVKFCHEKGIGLVIFDSLVRIHSADENDAVKMAAVLAHLKRMNSQNITVVFTHHNRKQNVFAKGNSSQDMRGSSDILASVDCHVAVVRKEEVVEVHQHKLRVGMELKPFKLNVIDEGERRLFDYAGEIDELVTKKTNFQEAIKAVLLQEGTEIHKRELFDKALASGANGGYSTFKAAVDELVGTGELFERRGAGNKVFCSLERIGETESLVQSIFNEGENE